MDLVAGAVGSIIGKLGELLQAEYKLQKGLPEQLESLKNELESAQAALLTVGQVPPEQLDPQARLWAREVREASYDMEDMLDTFLVDIVDEAAPADTESKACHDIAGAIEDMKKRLQEVSDRRNRYSIPVAVAAPATTVDPRLKDMHKEAAQIIGIERTRAELIAMLESSTPSHGDAGASSSSNQTKIVSVVGAGGLGKTTLAKAVYDELSPGPGYDCRAFVSVGRNPDLVQVFTSIFFHVDRNEHKAIRNIKDLQLLIVVLRKFLENKRYFIVIDDVWDIESWKAIRSALNQKSSRSRIIKTTRNREISCGDEIYYQLDPLTHDNSKKLFYMRLFGGQDNCPPHHPQEAAEKILHKCGGVPLAIITMASLLVGKSREDWFEVCNSPGFYRGRDNKQLDDTMHILSLSYYDLPSHLKTCLLYLSIFPEDTPIDKDSLIWMWIAEGFVEKKPGRRLFEVGEEYFHELINRNMIQGVHSEVIGVMDGCRVDDFIVSMSCKENFISVDGTLSQSHTRRLVLKNKELDLAGDSTDVKNLPQVRSFIVWGWCDIDKWALHPRLKLLRVLALDCCTFEEGRHNLEHIGNLLNLRYLSIRGSWIGEHLEGIGALRFLQTLELYNTNGDLELPCSIGMLTRLVCLRAPDITAPDGVIGRLTSLEELQIKAACDSVESQRQFLKDLGNLRELRVLDTRIKDESMKIDLVQSLGNLKKMQHLTLGNFIDIINMNAWDTPVPSLDLRCLFLREIEFPELPSWINSAHLPSLSHLEIHADDVDDQSLKALGGLPELCYLKLGTHTTATITEADGCFQQLRSLMLPHSTVVFVANEDSTPSFTICSKYSPVPDIGRKRKKDDCRVVPAAVVMRNLEELVFSVSVEKLMQNHVVSFEGLGLDYLPSIRRVEVHFWCDRAFKEDVEREEAALRDAIQVHPNRPALQTLHLGSYKKRRLDDDASASSHGMESTTKRPRC